ncbi:hypothetical protein [Thermocrinis minervae]|nr:hypothetical protein [Thermocrinis minervae]
MEGLIAEIKADIEEGKFLADSLLEDDARDKYLRIISIVEGELLKRLYENLEYMYDMYELFNFDLTILANLPEELERELHRLDIIGTSNGRIEDILSTLDMIINLGEEDERLRSLITPFKVYRHMVEHAKNFCKGVKHESYMFI